MYTHTSQRLFVRITTNELSIAPFIQHHADTHRARTIPLINNEIVGTHIVNLTALAHHLTTAAQEFGLTKPHLIIEAPFINETDPYAVLSLTLCCARHFTIERISTAPDSKNLLASLVPSGYHHIYRWGALMALCWGLSGYIMIKSSSSCNHALTAHRSQLATLTSITASLQRKATEAQKIEQENVTLEKKLTHRTQHATTALHPEKICTAIAHALPEAGKLVQLSIDHHPATLTIKGITQHPAEITGFIKKLATTQRDYNFSLVSLKKQKGLRVQAKQEPVLYAFAIQGVKQPEVKL